MTGRAVGGHGLAVARRRVAVHGAVLYALSKRLVNLAWGFPIAVYNILIATISITRYFVAHGWSPPEPLVAILAAQSLAMVFASGTATVMATRVLHQHADGVARVSRRRAASRRRFASSWPSPALTWSVFIIALGGHARSSSCETTTPIAAIHCVSVPDADFAIGLRCSPTFARRRPPRQSAVIPHCETTMDVDAVSVVVIPGATKLAIDSLAKVIEPARRDSTVFIVALGYRRKVIPELGPVGLDDKERLATLKLAIERLKPDIVLPAEDP